MKKWIVSLLALMMLAGSCAMAADSIWLPDPGPALGAEAVYNQTNTGTSGTTYDFYTYDFESDVDTMSHFIVAYTEALRSMGFTPKKLTLENAVYYESYEKGDYTAEMGVFVGDAKEIAEGGVGAWRVVLAVPEGMTFTAGSGAPGLRGGDTICIACNGTGKCEGCGGVGQMNYGSGMETCVICDGERICNVCDGEGGY